MVMIPDLPPGAWVSPEAEGHWEALLETWETIGVVFRQNLYLSIFDPRIAARYARPEYRARLESQHKIDWEKVEASLREHLNRYYVFDDKDRVFEFDLWWRSIY
jgi:hypothetical protein